MGKLTDIIITIFTLGTFKIGERVHVQDEEGKDHLAKVVKSKRRDPKYQGVVVVGREGKTKKVNMGAGYYDARLYRDDEDK